MNYTVKRFIVDVKEDMTMFHWTPWWLESGFWVVFSYRLRKLRQSSRAWQLMLPFDILVGTFRRCISDSRIPAGATIGSGLCLVHSRGIRISKHAVLGAHIRLYHQVTIGEFKGHAPVIEDRCVIYCGAKIVGLSNVGHDTEIGANCVVSFDVPHNTRVSAPYPYMSVKLH